MWVEDAAHLTGQALAILEMDDQWTLMVRGAETARLTIKQAGTISQVAAALDDRLMRFPTELAKLRDLGTLDVEALNRGMASVRTAYQSLTSNPPPSIVVDSGQLLAAVGVARTIVSTQTSAERQHIEDDLARVTSIHGSPEGDLSTRFRCALYLIVVVGAVIASALTTAGGARIATLASQGASALIAYDKSGCVEVVEQLRER